MKSLKSLILSLVVALFAIVINAHAAPQLDMDNAIQQLELARTAKNPIEHLEKAKHHLQVGDQNKGGERLSAIQKVKEAIDAAVKHEPRRMEDRITQAIKDIRQGKENARK